MLPSNHLNVNINRVYSSNERKKKKTGHFPLSHQSCCALKHSPKEICLVSSSFSDRILKTLPYLEVLSLLEYQKPKTQVYVPLYKHFNKIDPTAVNIRATSGSVIPA